MLEETQNQEPEAYTSLRNEADRLEAVLKEDAP